MSTELRYVYAVCRPFDAPLQAELVGVEGRPPRLLRHEDLTAVVGAVPEADFAEGPLRAHLEDLDWLTATARAHERVVAALTTVTSPLPLRLATVFRDDSGVRSMMQEEQGRFRWALGRLAGRVEWGVKVYADGAPEPRPETRLSGPGAGTGSGRAYLQSRRARRDAQDGARQRAEAFAERLHGDLARHAAAARVHPPQNPALSRVPGVNILNSAYLVDRSASEDFVERVDRTKDEEPGMRVELTGPWAGYSFTMPSDEGPAGQEEAGR
ncbi:GvpL/GvpF family gas vesicle protein [Streptomyces sp. NPDC055059]|jgi:hypothetical protein|uniref:GvpL/GvpF family gas vesicle protein n=1 Tax=unclassified Streptomyces TaxID=2593676 RepID=UPI00224EE5E0|nr:GvpL/GvpF family gas vesicle protein [Streptomyces sp. NBC_01446]MCX4642127.1 GvpL/GvpF family gas vesicle protein [Streptomyces sp. NBC_01446]